MARCIGIDFGTTNSLISVVLSDRVESFLNEEGMPHSSAVGYDVSRVITGSEVRALISDVSANLAESIVRSPKAMLGKGKIFLAGRQFEPAEVVTDLMQFLFDDAAGKVPEGNDDIDFTRAVVSIPVAMDGRTRKELRDALLRAGIHVEQFVHEPLAALYAFLKDHPNFEEVMSLYQGKLALVFDWGGGTLDLTLCHVIEGAVTQIMNVGDNNVGGDYIDEAIRDFIVSKYMEMNSLEDSLDVNPGARAKLLHACERAKIQLSERATVVIYIPDYFLTSDYDPDIQYTFTRDELNEVSMKFISRGLNTITALTDKVNIDQRQISVCLATGGMVNMPCIKQSLLQIFGIERLEVSKKGDRIISEGCAWIANDNLRMSLAKPIEVVEARQSYLKVFKSGTRLPSEGEFIEQTLDMYCVDPRDAKAKFQIVRPQHVNKTAATDPRVTYENLTVGVDKLSKPFFERLTLTFNIDDNFIVEARGHSTLANDTDSCEIYDLEFSLALPINPDQNSSTSAVDYETLEMRVEGEVCARSNVTSKEKNQAAVPGEVLHTYKPRAFDPEFGDSTKIQNEEKLYYQPCSLCKRPFNHPDCKCSTVGG